MARNYIILNGVNSNTITGLLISTLPPITKPKIRTQIEEIDGRDGDIVTKLGYSAYEKEFEIGLYGEFDINQVISYFNSEGTVVFSNEEDKYYNYQILEQIDYEKLIRFKTATIKMHVQPFKYPTEEEQIQVDATVVTGSGSDITLEYTSSGNIITSEVDGDTYQETTEGYNLYYMDYDDRTQDWNGVTVISTKTGYSISGKATGSGGYTLVNRSLMLPAGTYTIKIKKASSMITGLSRTNYYNVARIPIGSTSATFTLTEQMAVCLTLDITNGITYNETNEIMIYQGTENKSFEPYTNGASPNPDYPQTVQTVTGNQSIKIEGKNLFNSELGRYAIDGNGVLQDSTTRIATIDYTELESEETYTISYSEGLQMYIRTYDKDKNYLSGIGWNNKPYTYTPDTNVKYIRIMFKKSNDATITTNEISNIQIEKGSTATDYYPYQSQTYPITLGNIELCKIGDYQDRIYQDAGTWYIEKQIGKIESYNGETIETNYISTTGQLTTGATIYYVLATPTTTEITDTDLLADLNELAGATTYENQTNITVSGSLPASLSVSTQGMPNTVINNIGNIYAKPLITIYGSGNIGVYLNYIQVLQISLGDAGSITIDVAKMEAYNSSTQVLMNRLVTGDYMNFLINSGQNNLAFSGNVLGFTMDNYTRWL